MADRFEETRQVWKQRVEEWQSSGQNMAQWCREHQLDYKAFLYWKKRFSNVSQVSFIELTKEKTKAVQSQDTGIVVEYSGMRIHLDKDFHSATLKQCLALLREIQC